MVLYTLDDFKLEGRVADVKIRTVEMTKNIIAHHHEYYEIDLFVEGGAKYVIDGVEHAAQAGDLFLLKPSSFHEICFFEGAKCITIMFPLHAGILDYLFALPAEKPYLALRLPHTAISVFSTFAEELQASALEDPTTGNLYAVALLNCILGRITSFTNAQSSSKSTSAMSRAILYIQNHFTEDISLKKIADIAAYSTTYFSTQFKLLTGMSFKQYLTNMRFTFAKKLLKTTELPITAISTQCGFNDFSNFMTAFKKRYGMTPKQFRYTNTSQKQLS